MRISPRSRLELDKSFNKYLLYHRTLKSQQNQRYQNKKRLKYKYSTIPVHRPSSTDTQSTTLDGDPSVSTRADLNIQHNVQHTDPLYNTNVNLDAVGTDLSDGSSWYCELDDSLDEISVQLDPNELQRQQLFCQLIEFIRAANLNKTTMSQHFDVNVQLASGDLPARSKCNKLNSYNGYFACSRCLLEGRRCPAPCQHHTLYRWVDFIGNRCRARTQEHINQCVGRITTDARTSYDVLGLSPLSSILSIPMQSTFDYFHLALEIHLRTLRHYSNRSEIHEMPAFIQEYLELFPRLFNQCKELFSTHALYHLYEQVEQHGGLAYHSLFPTESSLNHVAKLAHGSTALGQQISYWWCVHRQISSKKTLNFPHLFTKQELIDSFIDHSVIHNFRQEFDLLYRQMFGDFPPETIQFYARFSYGLLMYHSLSYIRRNRSVSYNILIESTDKFGEDNGLHYFGQIVFFFTIQNKPYCLVKQWFRSKKKFSSLIQASGETAKWKTFIDKYYLFVCHAKCSLIIYPCSSIVSKCMIFQYDEKYSICTPIELEIEHD
ncbi:unnamed protein product [Rotaria magnacalcarata]|uniref:Uncharacterized protein n=1 Tax=Rotaria magnacalcarata TaxID=392030 RepID=A0A816SLM1_9BILA|nr:unnamed protein product [Rotaria magnacalcarata]CAF2145039.1 unnamed protein product [Rotaria magnacalcarata]